MADTIIVDTGAGIADSVMEFLVASSEILLVTTPEPTSITDSYSLLKALSRHSQFIKEETRIKLVANKIQKPGDGKILYEKLSTVAGKYLKTPMEYLGEVPEDSQLSRAVMQQKPVSMEFPRARSAQAYEQIAAILTDMPVEETDNRRGMASFFSHIFNIKR